MSGQSSWIRVGLDPAEIGATLRDSGFTLGSGDPVEAHGRVDREGRPRRVHARFADGWRVTLNLRRDGSRSLRMALRLDLPAPVEEARS